MTVKRVTPESMVAATGKRYCSQGMHDAIEEGGKTIVGANGRKRWMCANCAARKYPDGRKG